MADAGRFDAVTSAASALAVLLCGAVGVDIGLAVLVGPASAQWAWYGVAAWTFLQFGRAFLRLSGASIYPRANYYGAADIAPERPGADRAARRSSSFIGASAMVTTALCALTLLAVPQHVLPMAVGGLGIGTAIETALAIARRPERVERTLRGDYVLYLRSFAHARPMIALATVLAASPNKVVAILSPRRVEVDTFGWYLLAAFLPVQFERITFWATDDQDWHRVVASCMNSSRSIVFDCSGLPLRGSSADRPAGLEIEMGMSVSFAGDHPTAYITEDRRPTPMKLPIPSVLVTRPACSWTLRHFPAMVGRLRMVIDRKLSDAELAYLDQYHAKFRSEWKAAMVSDRNLAHREGRSDPHELLMSRDPLAAVRDELSNSADN